MNSPSRILMTTDAVGGVWQYSLDMAEGLRSFGFETTLAVLGPSPDEDQTRAARVAEIDLIETGLPLDWTASSLEEVEDAGRTLACIAATKSPDIVHLNSPALAATACYPAPVVATCHSCVATWWAANRTEPLPLAFQWQADLVHQGYRAAAILTAPTAAFAAATARTYGLPAEPRVVRNGRRWPDMAMASDLPEPFVFTAGRLWDDGKNLSGLDEAAATLSVPVLAAGPLQGPHGGRIEFRHIAAMGRLDERSIRTHLARRPIFASLARYEPFGLAVLEAAQAGCALLLSDTPTFRELWEGAATFVPLDDHREAAAAIERLLQDPSSRVAFGTAARERAGAYSVQSMCAHMSALYRELIDGGSKAAGLRDAAA